MTCDGWHVTGDTWHMTDDTWHVGWTFCQNFRFGIESGWKIFRLKDEWRNHLINDRGVCRTAPATPGLLTSLLRRLQAQTLPDAIPPIGKIHPFSKIAVTFEPLREAFQKIKSKSELFPKRGGGVNPKVHIVVIEFFTDGKEAKFHRWTQFWKNNKLLNE